MKKLLSLVLCLNLALLAFSQIKIIDVSVAATDISAVSRKRTDLNGNTCALVKVELPSPEAKFMGNIVGEVAYNTSEYWVYMSPKTKQMKIVHPGQLPLVIDFSKYGIPQLEGGNTYSVKLHMPLISYIITSVDNAFDTSTVGISNGCEWVDLGLPSGLKWASCNIGANNPKEYGKYFAWGQTEKKQEYTKRNTLNQNKKISVLKKRGIINANELLTTECDAAQTIWGNNWRMPSIDEWRELIDNCNWVWIPEKGKKGYLVTGPNGNSIFLPAAGVCYDDSVVSTDKYGVYWSSNSSNEKDKAEGVWLAEGNQLSGANFRYWGLAVRPVLSNIIAK